MNVRQHSAITMMAALAIGLGGCAAQPKVIQTGLEQQAYQSREFAVEKKIVFNSTMAVLQDAGYIISSADLDTGFITAKAPQNSRFDWWYGTMNEGAEVTATVEELSSTKAKVRLMFVNKSQRKSGWNPYQDVIKETGVQDPNIYNAVFDKIDQAIFIRQKSQ